MKNWKKYVLIAFLLGGITGGSIGLYLWFKPVTSTSELTAAYDLTANTLFADYQNDEAAANEKYLGKVLAISGTVAEIKTSESGKPALVLATDDPMFGVICEFEQASMVEGLEVGKKISLKGQCSGLLLDVVLSRCVINP